MVTHVSLVVSSLRWLERMDVQSLMLSYRFILMVPAAMSRLPLSLLRSCY